MIQRREDVLKVVNSAFNGGGKKKTQIKVFQVEYFKGKHPKLYLQTMENDKIKAELVGMGYDVAEKETSKAVYVSKNEKGEDHLVSRNIHTISWVISKR